MEYQIKIIFIENNAENMQQKLVPGLFIILVNNPKQPLHAIILKARYFEKGLLTKSLKIGNLLSSFEPSAFQ